MVEAQQQQQQQLLDLPETPRKASIPWRSTDTVVRSAVASWGQSDPWDPLASLDELFEYLLDLGDVQTPFHLALVIGIETLTLHTKIADKTVKRWCVHYLDLLSTMQLWTVRNRILRSVHWEDVRDLNRKGTIFGVNCPMCNHSMSPSSWFCSNCKKIAANCSLCRFPVKGLYSFCQTCGHGGHALEMRDWWKSSDKRLCPEPTCQHVCGKPSPG